jgi:hypothetical protein
MHWNGTAWTVQNFPLPDNFFPFSVEATSTRNVWGYGKSRCKGGHQPCATEIWHWTGRRFTYRKVPGLVFAVAGAGKFAWLLSLRDITDASSDPDLARPYVYRWNGAHLRQVTRLTGRIGLRLGLPQLAASPQGQLWMLAGATSVHKPETLFHWNGHRWVPHVRTEHLSNRLPNPWVISYDGSDGTWIGPYVHWTGRRWVTAFPAKSGPGSLTKGLEATTYIPGSASAWAVGSRDHATNGIIAVYGRLP